MLPPDVGTSPGDTSTPSDVAPDAPSLVFADDFARADSEDIGNGWIEKTPGAFRLTGGEVARNVTSGTGYRHHLVYRPATESVLDVEISLDVRVTSLPTFTPQLFVRGDPASIADLDAYTGYLLYGTADRFVLGRQEGNLFVITLSELFLMEALAVGPTYRMTLRAVGTSPVTLTARIDRMSPNGAVMLGQTVVMDTAATRITVPGSVGFSGDSGTPYIYDRFRRTPF